MEASPELFHWLALVHHAATAYYTLTLDVSATTDQYVLDATTRFSWRYISGWAFAMQVVFLLLCVAEDALRKRRRGVQAPAVLAHITAVRSFGFESLVFPMSCAVAAMFWLLYAIDRRLVFPKAFDDVVPRWLNHAVHTDVVLLVLGELALVRYHYGRRARGLATLGVFLGVYDVCFLYTHFHDGFWLYLVYAAFSNWTQRAVYMVVGHLGVFGLYLLGERLNALVWGGHTCEADACKGLARPQTDRGDTKQS